eukprot:244787_1
MTIRNNEFWNWSKTLIESVNYFGITIKSSNISSFYHGASMIYFSGFSAAFNCPTSTTTKLEVAMMFARDDGIIVELGMQATFIKYFNCTFVSCFGNEDERLFVQPSVDWKSLKLLSIR